MKKLLLLAALALGACATQLPDFGEEEEPLVAVGYLDLQRYMGRWYLIANIPYFAERGNVGVYVEYSMRDDGLIDDKYTAQDAFDQPPFTKDGEIEITNPITNSEGRITFLTPIWQDYAVIYIDKEYQYSLVAHPSRDYCWLFSRTPTMPENIYREMLAAARANGFDPARILKVPQKPEDVGTPGFQ